MSEDEGGRALNAKHKTILGENRQRIRMFEAGKAK